MLLWTITSVTRYGCFNCQFFFLKSATQELIEVSPDPKEKTLLFWDSLYYRKNSPLLFIGFVINFGLCLAILDIKRPLYLICFMSNTFRRLYVLIKTILDFLARHC